MIGGVLSSCRQGLRRLLKGLMWLMAAYPFLLVLMYYTTDVFFPNGAELNRNVDWQKGARGDLYLPDGQLIARDVNRLCWNETAVSGWGDPEGFIWLGGDHEVIYASDPMYVSTHEASGLGGLTGPCRGFYRPRLDAETLLGRRRPARPDD